MLGLYCYGVDAYVDHGWFLEMEDLGRRLISEASNVEVDNTAFGTEDLDSGYHVWNESGSTTCLGDTASATFCAGNNAFYHVDRDTAIWNFDGNTLKAEANWWKDNMPCVTPPPSRLFYGSVDRNPWICTEPSLAPGYAGSGAGTVLEGPRVELSLSPNPSHPFTSIRYRVPAGTGASQDVDVSVFDANGRRVQRLWHGAQDPGTYEIRWLERIADGPAVPAGIYFVRLRVGQDVRTSKLGALGAGCGATAVEPVTWGTVKTRFRD